MTIVMRDRLIKHAFYCSSTLRYVPLNPTCKHQVGITLYENLVILNQAVFGLYEGVTLRSYSFLRLGS